MKKLIVIVFICLVSKIGAQNDNSEFFGTYNIWEKYDAKTKKYVQEKAILAWEVFFDKKNSLILFQDSATRNFMKYELTGFAENNAHFVYRARGQNKNFTIDIYEDKDYRIIDCMQDSTDNKFKYKRRK